MKDEAESVVSDEQFAKRSERWSEGTPDTKEAYYIRDIFEGGCKNNCCVPVLTRL